MGRTITIGLSAVLGVLIAGCADEQGDVGTGESGFEEPVAAEADADAVGAAEEDVLLSVDSIGGEQAYLTDGEGRALYVLPQEPAGQSTCYEECAEEWPPFIVSPGEATGVAAPAQPNLIGTLQRENGDIQVTYNGQALYYYHDDTSAGETSGHQATDAWGAWSLLSPEGELVE